LVNNGVLCSDALVVVAGNGEGELLLAVGEVAEGCASANTEKH
jgi:hypothetical protein